MNTNPPEFILFILTLMNGAPEGYKPHLISLEPNGKEPVKGFSWEKQPLTIKHAKKRLEEGGNVGIAGLTHDLLVIVDRDNPKVKQSKDTLTVTSRKRIGEHDYYFRIPGEEIPNIPTEDDGEIRTNNQYVVAPGSYVPCSGEEIKKIPEGDRENAGKYSLKNTREPATINLDELPDIFLDQYYKVQAEEETRKVDQGVFTPHPKISPLYKLTYNDILPNIPNGIRTHHPLHGSDTGKNFIITGELAHCWRHNVSLTVPQYLAIKYGLLRCKEAGTSHTNGGAGPSKLTGKDDILQKLWIATTKDGFVKETDNPPKKRKTKIYPFVIEKKSEDGKKRYSINTGLLGEFILNNGQVFKTYSDTEQILVYKEGVYIIGKSIVSQQSQHLVIDAVGAELVKNIHTTESIGYVQRATYVERSEFDANPDVVNFKNGMLNILKKDMTGHSNDYLSIKQIPHEYHQDTECPKWLEFLEQVLPSETDRKLLQQAFGYCFLNGYPYHAAFLLEGKGGNGKGTVLHILAHILGENNVSNKELQDFGRSIYATASLYGKLANIAADIPDTKLERTGTFKSLCGGDRIDAQFKYQDSFTFRNRAKLFFSANQVPETGDDTDAFFQRWKILTFPNTFRGTDKEDPYLEDKLQEETQGIINWSIQGLYELLDNGGFTDNQSTDEKRDTWIRKSDTVAAFYSDCLEEDSENYVPKDELYGIYVEYCKSIGASPEHKQTLGSNLPRQSGFVKAGRRRIEGKLTTVWEGFAVHTSVSQGMNTYLQSLKNTSSVHTVHTSPLLYANIKNSKQNRLTNDSLLNEVIDEEKNKIESKRVEEGYEHPERPICCLCKDVMEQTVIYEGNSFPLCQSHLREKEQDTSFFSHYIIFQEKHQKS